MKLKVIIRKIKNSEIYDAWSLIARVFGTYNKDEWNHEAIQSAVNSYDPQVANHKQLKQRFNTSDIVLVAIYNNTIIWVIRGKYERIQALFVDGKYHRKWIGRQLLSSFEKYAKKEGVKKITVRSSLYAIPFYQKQWYKKITGIKSFSWWIKIQPMQKNI